MRVLIACEYSGRVRDAFAAMGHYAMSCDLLPSESPGEHYQGDIYDVLFDDWDLMVAHPPCTYLSNSGVCHLYKDPTRWAKMRAGAVFFRNLLHARIPRICIENPIMHCYAKGIIGRGQDQVIQPWQFGHKEKKATCLWLKGLPPLVPTSDLKAETNALPMREQQRLHYLSPGPDRWCERSRTFPGIANAMAEQWG